ncbi:GTP 3',8-cyclase MoaA [Candidatus Synechococcus calcipolaris]
MTLTLIDTHGRRIRKLRISLTDQCNLRCQYCMPVDATFIAKDSYLRPQEYQAIAQELVELGLEEIRLTGGEPLLRQDFLEIATRLAQLPLKKIGLTTNGVFLDRYLEALWQLGIHHLNISLDSLNPDNFQRITHGDRLDTIKDHIHQARSQGFRIKINMVVMRGINDHEIGEFVEYAKALDIDVRFLELMRIGYACETQGDRFISAQELLKCLKTHYHLTPLSQPEDSTSFNFVTDCGARIGFIASESQPFCGHCSRWRLSADGILRACLLKTDGRSLKNTTLAHRQGLYRDLLEMKPYLRPSEVPHAMYQIGG